MILSEVSPILAIAHPIGISHQFRILIIQGGKRVHPVREMLITGNFLTLWNNLLAAADDARPCLSKLVPTLAFANVDFSA